jgi:hypothetical protein
MIDIPSPTFIILNKLIHFFNTQYSCYNVPQERLQIGYRLKVSNYNIEGRKRIHINAYRKIESLKNKEKIIDN